MIFSKYSLRYERIPLRQESNLSQWIAKKTSYGQETLDKAFLILYICRSNYQWIKEKFKNNEK